MNHTSQADILIKSYNRAFYLDRCISSIKMNVTGYTDIIVLDDGTPKKYLDKVLKKHPEIQIKRSNNYQEKSESVIRNSLDGTPIDSFRIPTHLWREAVQQASEYFIITEDDVWFTKSVNLTPIISEMKKRDSGLCKLGWLGNPKEETVWAKIEPINEIVDKVLPQKLITGNKRFMTAYFNNQFKLFTMLYYLGIVDNTTKLKYWSLNSIMMGVYRKDYWLAIWQDSEEKLNERIQLINAASYYHQHKNNSNFILRTKEEVMKTTFQSSATNSYHQYGFDFDVNLANYMLNEAWLHEELDAMQNFPDDFSLEYLHRFFESKIALPSFSSWVKHFKDQYRSVGCLIEE